MIEENKITVINKVANSNSRTPYSILVWLLLLIAVVSLFYSLHYEIIYVIIPLIITAIAISLSIKKKGLCLICSTILFIVLIGCSIKGIIDDIVFEKNANLKEAILSGDPELVKRKIKEGYDVNSKDENGFTMLTLTFQFFYKERAKKGTYWEKKQSQIILDMLKILIDNNANINILDDYSGMAPLHYAVSEKSLLFREIRIKIVKLLIDRGADVNLVTKEGNAPLHIVIDEIGNIKIVEILIKNGADVNAINNEGKTPLDLAIDNNYIEIIKILQSHGGKTAKEMKIETNIKKEKL